MTEVDIPDTVSLTDLDLPEATEHHISMPPALVEAVQENPDLLAQLTRGQLAVVQDRMVKRVLGDPDATVGQLAVVHDALSKNARLKPEAAATAGVGFTVVINLTGEVAPKQIKGEVIDPA